MKNELPFPETDSGLQKDDPFIWDFDNSPHLLPVYLFLEFQKRYGFSIKDSLLACMELFQSVDKTDPPDTILCECKTVELPKEYRAWFCLRRVFETSNRITLFIAKHVPFTEQWVRDQGFHVSFCRFHYAGDIHDRHEDFFSNVALQNDAIPVVFRDVATYILETATKIPLHGVSRNAVEATR